MDAPADYDIKDYAQLTNNWSKDPTAYLDRYYSLYYKTVDTEADPLANSVYVRQSPNKVCVLGIVSPSTDIVKVVLNKNLVGEKVKKNTILCEFKDAQDNVVGHVKAEMEGKLLELNSRLEKEGTSLLANGHHMDTGFIAIILPRVDDTKVQLKGYQTEQEYKATQTARIVNESSRPNLETKSSCVIS
ncbi:uncharacterized protein EV154DRAFT_524786 [Mucor mucedo]|uniref:uncharacterized protein n=1 Tax=Mucor mucedo TaxID=29922 RepID=UPI0022202E5C|nr:uncharacterized protein EV154DRAFT_524786 [Mucor mucedo]KAI7879233.1 hypothetical protein EV154DRAFT_524786 [Mucor mucedo]